MKTMGYLGPKGTHSEAAAIYLSDLLCEKVSLRAYPEIFLCVEAAAEGEVDSALVPVENSLEGSVNITLDSLVEEGNLFVERELIWDVHNLLMAKGKDEKISVIYSHPQPLAQCRKYLKENFPDARLVAMSSSAKAAKLVSESGGGAAAISTARAGELYGLAAIAEGIEDNIKNLTRFYQISNRQPSSGAPDSGRALIVCQIDGSRAGSLLEVLTEFASRGVNMTRIESRPARTGLGEYIFFFDLEIEPGKSIMPIEESIAAVKKRSIWLKDLGRFPVIEA